MHFSCNADVMHTACVVHVKSMCATRKTSARVPLQGICHVSQSISILGPPDVSPIFSLSRMTTISLKTEVPSAEKAKLLYIARLRNHLYQRGRVKQVLADHVV